MESLKKQTNKNIELIKGVDPSNENVGSRFNSFTAKSKCSFRI